MVARQADSNLEFVVAGGYRQYLSEMKVTVHVPNSQLATTQER